MAEAAHVEQTPSQKPKRSFLQKLMRALLVIVVVLLLLVVFLVSFTQTSWFRNIVRSQIENLIEKNTNGTLTLGRIEGNFISGFTIYDAHLKLRGDSIEIISMSQLYARYSIWKFMSGSEIPVTTLILRSPQIQFIKLTGDSLWNYERLLPSKNSQAPSSPFNLTIDVQNLRIENGKLFVHDYNSPLSDTSKIYLQAIDWSNYAAQNIDLDMRAHIEGEKIQQIQINNLSFVTQGRDKTPFTLHHLELSANRNDMHTEITGLHIISGGSDIRLTAVFDPLRVLHGEPLDSLAHSHVKLHLSASSVNEKELRQFLPDLAFLESSPQIDLDAEGEFGKLKIKRGVLGFRRDGDIAFSGEIRNLHDPQHLYLDILLKARSLTDRTLRNYVPGLDIDDMQRFGTVNIEKLTFIGYTNNFVSNFDIRSGGGDVNGKGSLDLRSQQMIYAADISTKNINLARLLSDSSLKSDWNSSFSIKGRGTNPKTMQAQFSLDGAGTTAFKHYQLEKLHAGGKIGGGKLELENTDITLHSGASLHSDYAAIDFSGKTLSYDFDVTTKDLAITDFVPLFPPSSKVSVEANVSGSGLSANTITGSINAEISGLQQDKKPLPNITLQATLERDEAAHRVDVITSSIADLTFKGKYNIETIGKVFADRIQKISSAIKDRGKYDTLFSEKINLACSDSIDLSYTANIKDLRPIAPFIPNIIFLGSGKLNGSVIGCENGPIAFATEGNIHNFFMRARHPLTDSSGLPLMRLRDTKFSFTASGIGEDERILLHSLKSEFRLHTDSIVKFSGIIIEKPDVLISLADEDLHYQINTILPKSLGIYVSGTVNISKPDMTFQSDSLSLAFGKSFLWHNDRSLRLTVGADGRVQLDTLSMIRPKPGFDPENKFAERIKLAFRIKGDSIDYAYLEIPELDLVDVPKFFAEGTAVPELSEMKGRVSKMEASLHGSFSHPDVSAELALRNFTYHNVTIDSGRMNLLYKDLTLSGKAVLHVDSAAFSIDNISQERENFPVSTNNSFRLDIDSIPLLFSLIKYPGYASDSLAVSRREMSIRASGKDYPLDMFSPFIPVIANLHGLADIELSVNGTRENILYKGSVDTRRGSFVLPTTNMQYTFNGKLLLSNDEMKFVQINLANMPGDDPDGRGVLNGSLYFKGFNVEKFGLTLLVPNRISVLSEASKQTLKNIYGPLAIRTENGPLSFSGNFDSPMLSGNITLVQGYLTLPQSDVSSANLLNDGITYRIKREEIIDTLRHAPLPDSLKHILKGIAAGDSTTHYNDTAFEEAARNAGASQAQPQFIPAQLSFSDRMLYDLHISIPGNLWLTINFSKAYGLFPQVLTAELSSNGSLTYSRNEPGVDPIVNGTILVGNRSSYSFIKDFTPVTGTISFARTLDNPTLDITAEYTGLHKTSSSNDETIKIKLIIEGTREDLSLKMELYRKINGEYVQDSRPQEDVKSDVLTYLLNGSFASDAVGSTGNSYGSAPLSIGSQIVSGQVTSVLSSTFLKDYVKSVGVEYVGLQSATKFKFTGGYKDIVLNYGGTYSTTGSLTNDFSLEIPFSEFFNQAWAHNFLFQGEYHIANSSDPNSQGLTQPPIFLGRFLYRISP